MMCIQILEDHLIFMECTSLIRATTFVEINYEIWNDRNY